MTKLVAAGQTDVDFTLTPALSLEGEGVFPYTSSDPVPVFVVSILNSIHAEVESAPEPRPSGRVCVTKVRMVYNQTSLPFIVQR